MALTKGELKDYQKPVETVLKNWLVLERRQEREAGWELGRHRKLRRCRRFGAGQNQLRCRRFRARNLPLESAETQETQETQEIKETWETQENWVLPPQTSQLKNTVYYSPAPTPQMWQNLSLDQPLEGVPCLGWCGPVSVFGI